MSLFKHASEIMQARINHFLDNAEDPAETLDLSYEKMMSNLQDTKRHLADVATEKLSLEHQIADTQKVADQAEADARTALQANREDLAKAELAQKQAALSKLQSLQDAHDKIAAQVAKLSDFESKLQDKIESFRTQKEVMKGELAASQAEIQAENSLSGLGKGMNDAGEAMQRVQDRVSQSQSKAEAMESLMDSGAIDDPLDHRSHTDKEMAQLREQSGVDDDLARLKAEMAKPEKSSGS
ncbi:PspA/IM30 family protein [Acidithiobacillus acidisediminis]|uniref:PspA/IM30 family protein n=1 Tax=Acidithiobacillus acidisediminis TaxID=2937799 RepID=UPI00200C007B|nr:PspA/IM30 family protein [Acidithiobacillus sp. S30A2]